MGLRCATSTASVRARRLSNEQWRNPDDPDAKIGRTKDGATDMVYLPEHTVDLETGVARPGGGAARGITATAKS